MSHILGTSHLRSEINVTPLVDVVLVLLIIFIVIMPLALRGYDVDLAGTSTVTLPTPADDDQVVLGIDVETCALAEPPGKDGLPADCRVHLNHEDVRVTELATRVAEIFSTRDFPDRVLFLAVDEQANYEGVMRILDLAKSNVDGLRLGLVAG
jgi:biopolymer transport protein ExbD